MLEGMLLDTEYNLLEKKDIRSVTKTLPTVTIQPNSYSGEQIVDVSDVVPSGATIISTQILSTSSTWIMVVENTFSSPNREYRWGARNFGSGAYKVTLKCLITFIL